MPDPTSSSDMTVPPSAFVANHHRANNPNDAKLRANPSLRTRRTSLLSSVLKSKRTVNGHRSNSASDLWPKGISSETAMPAKTEDNGVASVPNSPVMFEASSSVPSGDEEHRETNEAEPTAREERPEIGARVRSLRTGDAFASQAVPSPITIIATPPTPRLSDLPDAASPVSMSPDGFTASIPASPNTTSADEARSRQPILPARTSSSSDFERTASADSQSTLLSNSVSMPLPSPQRFSSLTHAESGSARALLTSTSSQNLSDSLSAHSSAAQGRNHRRLSMLDFLSADPDFAPQHAADQSSSPQRRQTDGASSIPLSAHLLRAASQTTRKAVETKTVLFDFAEHIQVKVEPLVDHLTMFGSTQTSSHYSLAGNIVVVIPRDIRRRVQTGDGLSKPSVRVEALLVRFTGYSMYVDATGRFNAIQLADVSQDLLQPEGCLCYVNDDEPSADSTSERALRYEIGFDLSIPGWLPASQASRFGGTFYCIQAEATIDGQRLVSQPIEDRSSPVPPHAATAASLAPGSNEPSTSSSPPESGPQFLSMRSKSKGSWLGKTAKQLQLRSMLKSASQDGSLIADTVDRVWSTRSLPTQPSGSDKQIYSKLSEKSNVVLYSGLRLIKSECISILINRCRDVVPVPVARLAMLGRAYHATLGEHASPQALLAAAASATSPAEPLAPAMIASSSDPGIVSDAARLIAPRMRNRLSSLPPAISFPPTPTEEIGPVLNGEAVSSELSATVALGNNDVPVTLKTPPALLTASATMPNLSSGPLASSQPGNAQSPPRVSSRMPSASRPTIPMRHFLHRPTLQLPSHLGIVGEHGILGALSFSLTLSLPSHVQVSGPQSDTLSFGVQIEVGKSESWDIVRKLGGLRIRDMELVCLQTERHSSMPSRSFSAAFPLPSPPKKVEAADIPVVSLSPRNDDTSVSNREVRLRKGYDRDLVLAHIDLANIGKAPDPVEHNVERVRSSIVGPPPNIARKGKKDTNSDDRSKGKAKAQNATNNRVASRQPSRDQSPSGSGANTPDGSHSGLSGLRAAFAPVTQPSTGSGSSVMQPVPRSLARSRNTSSSSLRVGPSGMGTNAAAASLRPHAGVASRPRRSVPFEAASQDQIIALHNDSETDAQPEVITASASLGETMPSFDDSQPGVPSASTTIAPSASSSGLAAQRPPARRSRFETAMNRLSTFANAMLDPSSDNDPIGAQRSPASIPASRGTRVEGGLRATYAFAGDDGEGVDLTKGRVRMTINLPLVSSDVEAARKMGGSPLVSDFESPYVRIRHKLKVKLGFGLNCPADDSSQTSWGQALVMCVPVRFTEAPPLDVQQRFAPSPVGQAEGDSTADVDVSAPLLPAYTQLFREDGSRLADEGEDLPRYTGRVSVVGEIDTDPAAARAAPMLAPDDDDTDGSAASAVAPDAAGGTSASPAAFLPKPALLQRSTSLRGRGVLLRTTSASLALPQKGSRSVSRDPSPANRGGREFDALPARPGMRRRSTTLTTLISSSRITPAEVLDEALVINSQEEEEDRIETLDTGGLDEEEDDMGVGMDVNMHLGDQGEDAISSGASSDDEDRGDQIHFRDDVHPSEAEEIVQVGQAW